MKEDTTSRYPRKTYVNTIAVVTDHRSVLDHCDWWRNFQTPRILSPSGIQVKLLYIIKSIWILNIFNIDLKMRSKLRPQPVLKVGCSLQHWHSTNTGGAWHAQKSVSYPMTSTALLSSASNRRERVIGSHWLSLAMILTCPSPLLSRVYRSSW